MSKWQPLRSGVTQESVLQPVSTIISFILDIRALNASSASLQMILSGAGGESLVGSDAMQRDLGRLEVGLYKPHEGQVQRPALELGQFPLSTQRNE